MGECSHPKGLGFLAGGIKISRGQIKTAPEFPRGPFSNSFIYSVFISVSDDVVQDSERLHVVVSRTATRIVDAQCRGAAYRLGSTAEASTLTAVLAPLAVMSPTVPPVALDVWEWLGISPVVRVCVSAPPEAPMDLEVKPDPLPWPTTTLPERLGRLNVVVPFPVG